MRSYVTVMAETNIPSFAHAPSIISQTVPIRVCTSCRIISKNFRLQCFETTACECGRKRLVVLFLNVNHSEAFTYIYYTVYIHI